MFKFQHHIIDTDLPKGTFAQTALADIDNDGQLEYITGRSAGEIFWYKYHAPDNWTRHLLGDESPSDVGGCVLDVDRDGHEAVVGDITGNGKPDVLAKPWRAAPDNAVDGKLYVVFLENIS